MANNAMPMLMMMLLIGGGIVAFVKRCEWFKMCDDKKFKQDIMPEHTRFYDQKTGKFTPEVRNDLSVKMVGNDGSTGDEMNKDADPFLKNPVNSKFARISYF